MLLSLYSFLLLFFLVYSGWVVIAVCDTISVKVINYVLSTVATDAFVPMTTNKN